MARSVSYAKLENTLDNLGAQLTAAEAHGLLVGMLSLRKPMDDKAWRTALLENLDCAEPTKVQWQVLSTMNAQILETLNSEHFDFKLLLPGDSAPLVERIDALGHWCRGYLSGLGLVGITQEDLANSVIKELVHDLSQIAHISVETDDSEDDEHNYMELVEYLRIAVQNIQLELQRVWH